MTGRIPGKRDAERLEERGTCLPAGAPTLVRQPPREAGPDRGGIHLADTGRRSGAGDESSTVKCGQQVQRRGDESAVRPVRGRTDIGRLARRGE